MRWLPHRSGSLIIESFGSCLRHSVAAAAERAFDEQFICRWRAGSLAELAGEARAHGLSQIIDAGHVLERLNGAE